jgi:hypothetical protein
LTYRVISGKWPTWRTISSIICLFESSTCFEQLCAYLQEDNCMNTTSGIITLKTIEWSKITKINRIHCSLIGHKTLTINDKILVKLFKCSKFNWLFCVVNVLHHAEVMFT